MDTGMAGSALNLCKNSPDGLDLRFMWPTVLYLTVTRDSTRTANLGISLLYFPTLRRSAALRQRWYFIFNSPPWSLLSTNLLEFWTKVNFLHLLLLQQGFHQLHCTPRQEELPWLCLEPVTCRFHQVAGDITLQEKVKFVPYSPSTHQLGFYSPL